MGELLLATKRAKGAADGTPGPGRGKRGTTGEPRLSDAPTLAELLLATKRAKGVKMSGRDVGGNPLVLPKDDVPTLAELGVSKKEASQAQRLAKTPE